MSVTNQFSKIKKNSKTQNSKLKNSKTQKLKKKLPEKKPSISERLGGYTPRKTPCQILFSLFK